MILSYNGMKRYLRFMISVTYLLYVNGVTVNYTVRVLPILSIFPVIKQTINITKP